MYQIMYYMKFNSDKIQILYQLMSAKKNLFFEYPACNSAVIYNYIIIKD